MIYTTPADIHNMPTAYSARSINGYNFPRPAVQTEGLFGSLYYLTDFYPQNWTLETGDDFNAPELADYLLASAIDSDPRVTKAISEHFWDF